MIAKKSKKANLERKRFALFQIGLLLSGAMCLAAFEYKTAETEEKVVVFEENRFNNYPEPIADIYDQKDEPKQQERRRVIDINNVVEGATKPIDEGTVVTSDPDITIDEGDFDPFGGIDLGGIVDPEEIVPVPDVEPTFPGGFTAMGEWLQNEIDYPQEMIDMGLSDQIYIHFVVNKDGSISNIDPAKFKYEQFAKEGIRVVKRMPKWIPGEVAGKPVRVRFTLPINFQLPK